VGIAGLGGLGSSVAIALARVGVGTLVVADFDVVEPSNLNRQQYFLDQIGMPKVKALKENLARINPHVTVECHELVLDRENIPRIFAGTPIVVEAFDRADMKEMIITTVLEKMPEHKVVAASGLAGYGPNNSIRTERIARNRGVTREDADRLFELSLALLCVAGTDGYFKHLNPAFERTLGHSRDELLARPFYEFVHPEDRERTVQEVEKLATGIPTVHFENRFVCKNGSYRWLAWTATPEHARASPGRRALPADRRGCPRRVDHRE
jgi:thiamine biosynthesis protein ThiF family 2